MAEIDGAAATNVRRLLTAFQDQGEPRLLTDALGQLRALLTAPGFGDLEAAARAFVWTLGAVAFTWRSRTSEGQPDDLDDAISLGQLAVAAWPAGDPNLARAQVNLATALTDRYQRDSAAADLERAMALFDSAVPLLRERGERLDIALHSHGLCYHERAGGRDVTDLDLAIERFHEALACQEPDPEERAGYLNSLGLSLRAKGLALANPALLAEASATYQAAREQAPLGRDSYVAATLNQASVLQDRAEADNDSSLLVRAVRLYRDLLPTVDGQARLKATSNLATALIDLYRYSRDNQALEDAARDLRRSADSLPEGPGRQRVLANLGAALHEMFDHTGRIALLDQAIAMQDQALAAQRPRTGERTLNLGISLLARYRRRRTEADLDRAIGLFEETARITASRIERASALNSHANALSLRFDGTGVRADIDRCVQLREQAIVTAAPGSLDLATYRGNLGVDLLKRFELSLDPGDLERAIGEQRLAVRQTPARSADQPRLLAGLADSLAGRAALTRDAGDVEVARAAYRRAVDAGSLSLPEQALGAAIRWGAWEARFRRWAEAGEAYELGLAAMTQLIGRQQLRTDKESWLADARGLPAAAGYVDVRAGNPRRAVIAIEHGRAMLLVEALQRRSVR